MNGKKGGAMKVLMFKPNFCSYCLINLVEIFEAKKLLNKQFSFCKIECYKKWTE
jgi:hypothetical protein